MGFPGTIGVNTKGHLEIGGCDTVELAKTYGTPLYVFDEAGVRTACRTFREELSRVYSPSRVAYAGKAFLTKAMAALVAEEGLYLDVVSGGELYTAVQAGFPLERLIFHGNVKTVPELRFAVREGVGRIVVDSTLELDMLNEIASFEGKSVPIYLRLTPGVDTNTHSYIQTGQLDSKFGFGIESGQALEAALRAVSLPNIELVGIHCHIGSQITDLGAFSLTARIMMGFMTSVRDEHGIVLSELDLGGGLGIGEDVVVSEYIETVASEVALAAERAGLPRPILTLEPGRSIAGPYGITLYTVGPVKQIPGIREYVAVDGGMTDNPRPALYQAKYKAIVANRALEQPNKAVSVAGRCCETGDILIKDCFLADPRPGDVLAVFDTGAYNYSMSSNYNRLPRPAIVGVLEGKSYIMVERETYADVCAHDVIPAHFARDVNAVRVRT